MLGGCVGITMLCVHVGHQAAGAQRRARREVGAEALTRANPKDLNTNGVESSTWSHLGSSVKLAMKL